MMPSAITELDQIIVRNETRIHTRASNNYPTDILIDNMNRGDTSSFGIAITKIIQTLPLGPVPHANNHSVTYG